MLNRLFGGKPTVPEIDVTEFARTRVTNKNVQVVDVREPNEWTAGHLADSTLIPLGELGSRLRELDPACAVVVVCRSGSRSATATDLLLRAGFRDVKNLTGGMIAWTQAGYPVAR